MTVGTFHFSQCGSEQAGTGVFLLDALDHFLETVDLRTDVFSTSLWSRDIEAELKVFFITDQDI